VFKRLATLALASLAGAALACAATVTTKETAKKPAVNAKAPSHTASVHKTSVHKTSSHKVTSRRTRVPTHSYLRSGQQAPTPDRYKEIQQALADRGYYRGEVNGAWGPDSVDALKRFQMDQKLAGDGKLDSLSLIALGLGPKRTLSAQAGQPKSTQP